MKTQRNELLLSKRIYRKVWRLTFINDGHSLLEAHWLLPDKLIHCSNYLNSERFPVKAFRDPYFYKYSNAFRILTSVLVSFNKGLPLNLIDLVLLLVQSDIILVSLKLL